MRKVSEEYKLKGFVSLAKSVSLIKHIAGLIRLYPIYHRGKMLDEDDENDKSKRAELSLIKTRRSEKKRLRLRRGKPNPEEVYIYILQHDTLLPRFIYLEFHKFRPGHGITVENIDCKDPP
jgi:hypothetical protein